MCFFFPFRSAFKHIFLENPPLRPSSNSRDLAPFSFFWVVPLSPSNLSPQLSEWGDDPDIHLPAIFPLIPQNFDPHLSPTREFPQTFLSFETRQPDARFGYQSPAEISTDQWSIRRTPLFYFVLHFPYFPCGFFISFPFPLEVELNLFFCEISYMFDISDIFFFCFLAILPDLPNCIVSQFLLNSRRHLKPRNILKLYPPLVRGNLKRASHYWNYRFVTFHFTSQSLFLRP